MDKKSHKTLILNSWSPNLDLKLGPPAYNTYVHTYIHIHTCIYTYIHAKHLKLTLGSDKQKLNTFLLLKTISCSQFVMPRTDTFHSADFSYTVSITYNTYAIFNSVCSPKSISTFCSRTLTQQCSSHARVQHNVLRTLIIEKCTTAELFKVGVVIPVLSL